MRSKLFGTLFSFLFGVVAFSADFRAGIAVRVVTPDPLLPVSGGVGPSHPATRKLGDLTVRALVLEQGATRVAFVSGDFLGLPGPLGSKVRSAITEIPGGNILIGATHTHSAPDCYGFPGGGMDPKYLETVCTRMVETIKDAAGNLKPAKLKIATGEAQGRIAYNYYAEKLYDPRCHVIQAVDASGKAIATLVNYAIHPEVLGSERGVCSPDLVGPLYERLVDKGGGVGIFMNSAQGGMITADNRQPGSGEANSWDECQRIGNLLADEALRIVAEAPEQASPKLFCAAQKLTLPVDSQLMRALLKELPAPPVANNESVVTQLNLVNVGNAQILTIPGEALPNIGFYLKRKMRGEHNLLFGLTNDAFGYILTKEDFNSFKRYEYVSRTSLGERTCEVYENAALKLVNDSPAPEANKNMN